MSKVMSTEEKLLNRMKELNITYEIQISDIACKLIELAKKRNIDVDVREFPISIDNIYYTKAHDLTWNNIILKTNTKL